MSADASNVSAIKVAPVSPAAQAPVSDPEHRAGAKPPADPPKPAPKEGGGQKGAETPLERLITLTHANVPPMLKELPVWLLWRKEKGADGKIKKVPVYANGKNRNGALDSPKDRGQLVKFDAAVAALCANNSVSGLGVALGEVPGEDIVISGIDFDDCYDAQGALDERVNDVLLAAMSYAEKSQSGQGVHVLGRGRTGTTKKDTRGLEIYDGKRFFVMTGDRIGGALGLADITDAATVARERFEVKEKHQGDAAAQGAEHQGDGRRVAEGGRNAYLSREAFRLRKGGMSVKQLLPVLRAMNDSTCEPPLPDEEVQQIARGKARIQPEPRPDFELPPVEAYEGDARRQQARETGEAIRSAPGRTAPEAVPDPLRRELPPAEPYPLHLLPDVLEPAARRIHEVVQAPAAMCGLSVLAAAALAAQPHADVMKDGRREQLSLFALTIAESGERKTEVDNRALGAHKEHERECIAAERKALKEYEREIDEWEAARSEAKSKKGSARQEAMDALGYPPKPPPSGVLLVSTPTLEGLHKLYMSPRANVGLFHNDAGEFLGGHAMNSDNKLKSAAGLSRLWDSGEFDRSRVNDRTTKHYGRRLALHLMVQPMVAGGVLSDEVLSGQGFLARCLLAWPESTIGYRPYQEVDLSTDPALAAYRERMTYLLKRPPVYAAGPDDEEGDADTALDPPILKLAPDANTAWQKIHDAIETDMRDGGTWASIRPWANKAPAQILRIAGVLTVVTDPYARVIQAETVSRAAGLMDWHLREALRIVGHASDSPEIRAAAALLEWCRKERIPLLYSSIALSRGPVAIRNAESFAKAIEWLERTGSAVSVPPCEVDGKPRRKVWQIKGAGA